MPRLRVQRDGDMTTLAAEAHPGPDRAEPDAPQGAARPRKPVTPHQGKGPDVIEAGHGDGARWRPWWSWVPARPWTCPRREAASVTAEAGPGCRACGAPLTPGRSYRCDVCEAAVRIVLGLPLRGGEGAG